MPPRSTAAALMRAALAGAWPGPRPPDRGRGDDARRWPGRPRRPSTRPDAPAHDAPAHDAPRPRPRRWPTARRRRRATVTAVDEASYRDALDALSTAPSGSNTLILAADIVVDDGTDPTTPARPTWWSKAAGHTSTAYVGRRSWRWTPGGHRCHVPPGSRSPVEHERRRGAGGRRRRCEVGLRAGRPLSGNRAGGDAAGKTSGQLRDGGHHGRGNAADGAGGGASAAGAVGLTRVTFAGNRARTGRALLTGDAGLIDATVTANGRDRTQRRPARRSPPLPRPWIHRGAAPVAANLDLVRRPSVLGTVLADPRRRHQLRLRPLPFRPPTASATTPAAVAPPRAGRHRGDDPSSARSPTTVASPGPCCRRRRARWSTWIDLPCQAGPMFSCTTFDDQRGTRPQDGNGVPGDRRATYGPYGSRHHRVVRDIGAVGAGGATGPWRGPNSRSPRFTGRPVGFPDPGLGTGTRCL